MDQLGSSLEMGQERRTSRLASLLSLGLPPLSGCAFDLDALLSKPVVDLKKVSEVLQSEVQLRNRILRLCDSALLGVCDGVRTIPEGLVLLGPDHFRALVLSCAVTEFLPHRYRDEIAGALWAHGAVAGALCEQIACLTSYCAPEQAHLAGILHNMGQLPLLLLVREEGNTSRTNSYDWQDNLALERDYFGADHCEIGKWMAKTWHLPPALVDAVQYHHAPERAKSDPQLAEIVSAADYLCRTRPAAAHEENTRGLLVQKDSKTTAFRSRASGSWERDRQYFLEQIREGAPSPNHELGLPLELDGHVIEKARRFLN